VLDGSLLLSKLHDLRCEKIAQNEETEIGNGKAKDLSRDGPQEQVITLAQHLLQVARRRYPNRAQSLTGCLLLQPEDKLVSW